MVETSNSAAKLTGFVLQAHLLPEAEAHGPGQDARKSKRAKSRVDASAYGRTVSRRWSATRRNGERLSHRWGAPVNRNGAQDAEADVCIVFTAHGSSSLLLERLMISSDAFTASVCQECGHLVSRLLVPEDCASADG